MLLFWKMECPPQPFHCCNNFRHPSKDSDRHCLPEDKFRFTKSLKVFLISLQYPLFEVLIQAGSWCTPELQDVLHTEDFSTFPERLPATIIWAVKGRTWYWILIKWIFSTVVTIAEESLAPLALWCLTYSDISYCTAWFHRSVVRWAGIWPLLENSRFEQLVPPVWHIKLFIYLYKKKTQRFFSKVQSLLSPHSWTHCTTWVSPKAATLIQFPLINLSQ